MNSDYEIWRKVFKRNDKIVSREIAGETILVPIRGRLADMQQIFSLNPAAEYIWQQMDGQKNLQDIRDSLLRFFDVEKEVADSDIQEFIHELLKTDLITGAG